MLAKSDRYLIFVQVSVAFLYPYAKDGDNMKNGHLRTSENFRELWRILENFGEGTLEKNLCKAFSSYFCTRRRNRAKAGRVLAYPESSSSFFIVMNAKLMRVVQQGEAFAVQSQKSENGQLMKCNIVLQEMGGKFENQYVATMLGNMAMFKLAPGDLVAVTLRFSTREYNGQVFQDILLTDIYKFN